MEITDNAVASHFTGDGMSMARTYNPYTKVRSAEKGSVWMYTSAIEAVNAILQALEAQKEHGNADLYNKNFSKYSDLLSNLYDNADYYQGTFTFTSYTQTKNGPFTVLTGAVPKVQRKWRVSRTCMTTRCGTSVNCSRAYKITNDAKYLTKAEYLTSYVLDGWDATRDANGAELGGITWGPGYVTKHSCSNGPLVSSLVWLHELYKDKSDEITHLYIDATDKQTRVAEQVKKSDYYLDFAKKIYGWQKDQLLRGRTAYTMT